MSRTKEARPGQRPPSTNSAWFPKALASALAIAGPGSVAGAHFVQSMVLLWHISQPAFGSFAFLLGFAALGWSAWQAVFCAPLPRALEGVGDKRGLMIEGVAGSANLLTALGAIPIFFVVPLLLGLDTDSAVFFAAFAFISLLRWFGRAHAYLRGSQAKTITSDWLYAAVLLTSVFSLALAREVTITNVYIAMAFSALVGLGPFGTGLLRVLTAELWRRPVARWIRLTRSKSSWSLASVIFGELASRGHAYVVIAYAGATSYAPIAATALLVRPMTFASVAMQDVERPRLARLIARRSFPDAQQSLTWARGTLAATWFASCAAVAALLSYNPHLLFPRTYDWHDLVVGSVLWLLVSGLAIVRMPDIALLQALGRFREIAAATAQSAAVSVVVAIVLVVTAGPIWSIGGIFAGRLVNTYQFAVIRRRWRRDWTTEMEREGGAECASHCRRGGHDH